MTSYTVTENYFELNHIAVKFKDGDKAIYRRDQINPGYDKEANNYRVTVLKFGGNTGSYEITKKEFKRLERELTGGIA